MILCTLIEGGWHSSKFKQYILNKLGNIEVRIQILKLFKCYLDVKNDDLMLINARYFSTSGGIEIIIILIDIIVRIIDCDYKNGKINDSRNEELINHAIDILKILSESVAFQRRKFKELFRKSQSSSQYLTYPMPQVLSKLTNKEALRSIIQALLIPSIELRENIVEVLSNLVKTRPEIISTLRTFGTPELLLLFEGNKSNNGNVINLLLDLDVNIKQFFPYCLVRKKEKEGIEEFIKALNTYSIETPDLIWNDKLFEHLRSTLRKHVEPY